MKYYFFIIKSLTFVKPDGCHASNVIFFILSIFLYCVQYYAITLNHNCYFYILI